MEAPPQPWSPAWLHLASCWPISLEHSLYTNLLCASPPPGAVSNSSAGSFLRLNSPGLWLSWLDPTDSAPAHTRPCQCGGNAGIDGTSQLWEEMGGKLHFSSCVNKKHLKRLAESTLYFVHIGLIGGHKFWIGNKILLTLEKLQSHITKKNIFIR